MPRTATIALVVAGLAAAAWYTRRAAGRWVYQGIQIGRAIEAERAAQGVAADTPG